MKKVLLTIAALVMMTTAANAMVLWDQAPDTDLAILGEGYPDSYSIGFFGNVIVYGACDFNLGIDATITSVTTYYTASGQWVPGTYDALLDVYTKTGPSPITGTDDPLATGVTVSVTLTDNGDGTMSLTATGLSLSLTAGDYWIMMSPTIADGPSFREFHAPALAAWGDDSNVIEFGGFFGPAWGPAGMDGAITIEGDSAVPTEDTTWGQFKAIYR